MSHSKKDNIHPVIETDLPDCLEVIHKSFSTVAKEFGLTEQNCPNHTSFMKIDKLQAQYINGSPMYGYFINGKMVGYVSLTKNDETSYELRNLAVLPETRHLGIGKELLAQCKAKVKQLDGKKITIGIIEENTQLKNWYASFGFVHTGTKKFDHLPFTAGFMELEVCDHFLTENKTRA